MRSLVDDAEVDGAARRLGRPAPPPRAGGGRGTPGRAARDTSAPSRTRARPSSSASLTQRMRLGEARRRPLEQPECLERDHALRRRRHLDDLGAAVGERAAARPSCGANAGEIVLLEPARRDDRGRDLPRVETGRSVLGDARAGSRRGREGARRRRPAVQRPSSGGPPTRCQISAVRGATANPCSAASIAAARQASRPSRPWRAASAAQPATAPGTVTERGPSEATGASGSAPRGAGPAASRPSSRPSRQTSAKQSPPMPVDIGSVTQRTAAAAIAASAAFPPCSRIRSPARVASGWLVATIAPRGHGGRPAEGEPVAHERSATSAAGPSMRVKRGTTESTLSRAQ